jgi:hypothetical protein
MKTKNTPNQDLLKACLNYDPETGALLWKVRPEWTFPPQPGRTPSHIANAWNAAWAGKPALNSAAKNGYLRGTINGSFYYAHRIIWKLVHNVEPDDIDHDDGNRSNNVLKNLFARTREDNLKNRRLSKNNTSGYHGVSFSKRHKLWSATIYHEKKPVHLGWFKEFDEAVEARKAAEIQYAYHPNHGRNQNQADNPVGPIEST